MLLERLPVAVPQPDEPTTAESTASNLATFEQVTRALRSLVEAGIMPAEAFERYRIKKLDEEFESKNGDWNKTMQ